MHYFPLTVIKLLDFETFTDILVQENAREAQLRRFSVLLSDCDIRKMLSMKSFTTSEVNWFDNEELMAFFLSMMPRKTPE